MSQPCSLCGLPIIDRCYAHGKKAWLARFQPIKSSRGWWRLLEPNVYERRGIVGFHIACWSVVKTVYGPDHDYDDSAWLARVDSAFRHLKPWLEKPRHPYSPYLCDDYNFESKVTADGRGPGCFDRFGLPTEIVHDVYDRLSDWRDVMALMQASLVPPSANQLLSMGRKYLAPMDSPFVGDTDQETLDRITWLLWNLQSRPDLFPHTLNYKALWDNVELIRKKLARPLQGTPLGAQSTRPPQRHIVHATHSIHRLGETTALCETISKISLYFSHIGDKRYLCGLAFDGNPVGYRAESSIIVSVAQFRGLLLASDGFGFTAVKVKDGASWQRDWYGTLPDVDVEKSEGHDDNSDIEDSPPTFSQLEWPAGRSLRTHLFVDSFKVQRLACILESPPIQNSPFVWVSKLPPQRLTPRPLRDLCPLEYCLTFRFIDGDILKTVTGITAYTDEDMLNRRFDFISNGEVVGTIGTRCPEDSMGKEKVSFHLSTDRDEKITGVACASRERTPFSTLSVKFLTSCGRSILFGAPSSKWQASWSPHGIFGATRKCSRRNRSQSFLEVLGVFKDQTPPETAPPSLPYFEDVRPWQVQQLRYQENEPRNVLVSEADFTSASKITVYTKSVGNGVSISGMKVFRGDDDYDATILGQPIDETKTFDLDEAPESISVCYTVTGKADYRINGLRFKLGRSKFVGVGCLKGSITQNLNLSKDWPMLYWAFSSSFDYVSTDSTFPALTTCDA